MPLWARKVKQNLQNELFRMVGTKLPPNFFWDDTEQDPKFFYLFIKEQQLCKHCVSSTNPFEEYVFSRKWKIILRY
jgi:hypothetical protein